MTQSTLTVAMYNVDPSLADPATLAALKPERSPMPSVGNLGNYQRMVELAKRAGGPGYLLIAAGTVGYGVFRLGEFGLKAGIRALRSARDSRANTDRDSDLRVFLVASRADGGRGLTLQPEDRFRVIAQDGDAVMIEVIGDDNNPWFVSAQLLESISDFGDESVE